MRSKYLRFVLDEVLRRAGIILVCGLLLFVTYNFWAYTTIPYPVSLVTLPMSRLIDSTLEWIALHPIRHGLTIASAIVIGYFLAYEVSLTHWRRRLRNIRGKIENLPEDDRKRLLGVSRREQSMIEMGSLFVPTAFVLLGAAATASHVISPSARIALAVSAPVLYVLWLFLVQLSTRLMDDIATEMHLYANDGAAEVLRDFYQDRHGFGVMLRLRRNHWLFYIPLITLGMTLIIHSIIK